MNTRHLKISILLVAASLTFASCYDDMLTFNEDNNATGTGDGSYATELKSGEEISGYLKAAEGYVVDNREHKYQYQHSLHVQDFAGYMSVPHNFEGRIASSFAFNNDFASGPYANFQWVAQQVVPVINTQKTMPEYAPLYAMGKLMYAQSAYDVAVVHGPVPFDDYLALKETHPLNYEKQSEVFVKILAMIDDAIADIETYQAGPDSEVDNLIVMTDEATKESDAASIIEEWRKYGNSMKLRIAMTCKKVQGFTYEGKTMQQVAEEAVASGVFEYGDYGMGLTCGPDQEWGVHPLYKIANNWVDTRLNASYHNILVRCGADKLLEYFFVKNTADLYNNRKQLVATNGTQYMSMRSGVYLRDKSNDQDYILYSRFTNFMQGEPLYWMKAEEVMFLRAEGALYEWNMGGDPEQFYEEGIRQFLTRHGYGDSDVDAYLTNRGAGADIDNPDYQYIDWYDSDNNLSTWDGMYLLNNGYGPTDTNKYSSGDMPDGSSRSMEEVSLEKIMTQKWIAMYPMSNIAWTDIRRTGYPRLVPPVTGAYQDADGSIDENTYVRRLPYSYGTDTAVKDEIETVAVPVLNEETSSSVTGNRQGVRLWWDVEGVGNFD